MKCGRCGCACKTVTRVNPHTGRFERHACEECRREAVPCCDPTTGAVIGLNWCLQAGYCHCCRTPTWRIVQHGMLEYDVLLWPLPTMIRAGFDVEGSTAWQDYCSASCAPVIGALPKVAPEVDGAPLTVGACKVLVAPHDPDHYAYHFSEQYGDFLTVWLCDEVRLEEHERDEIMAEWRTARAALVKAEA